MEVMREKGKEDALDLRSRSAEMSGAEIIREENKVPAWDGQKDYSGWAVGSPVSFNEQVYTLLQPHNAAHYPDANPENTPALWSITHTTDVDKAKPYLAPNGTSGLYMKDEACIKDGKTWVSLQDNNPYPPGETGTETYWAEYQAEEPEEPDEPSTEEPGSETAPEFVQPTGAHDAYQTGDRVTYNGQVYESVIDNNVWSPDTYPAGWQIVE